MGRPSFRGDILRDNGTEKPESFPTMGTAPKTQELTKIKKKALTPKGVFRHLAHSSRSSTERDTRQTRLAKYIIPYDIANKERSIAPGRHRNSQE